MASGAINPYVVNVTANSRLEDGFGNRDRQQIVFAWLDGIDLSMNKRTHAQYQYRPRRSSVPARPLMASFALPSFISDQFVFV